MNVFVKHHPCKINKALISFIVQTKDTDEGCRWTVSVWQTPQTMTCICYREFCRIEWSSQREAGSYRYEPKANNDVTLLSAEMAIL